MRVEIKKNNKTMEFKDVPFGDVVISHNAYYMKIRGCVDPDIGLVNAVNIVNGDYAQIPFNTVVTHVECKVVIEEE